MKNKQVESVIPYNHQVLITPLAIPTALVGSVNGVITAGSHEIPVTASSFTAIESQEIMENLSANRGVYCKITTGATDYVRRIVHATVDVSDELTKIWIFPALEVDTADADVISVGGDIEIDIGIIGDDGLNITATVTNDDALTEYQTVASRVSTVTEAKLMSPTTIIDINNYLLIAPNSFFRIKDAEVKFAYGMNAGFFEAVPCKVKVVSRKDPTDINRWQTLNKALLGLEEFGLAGNKDRTKYLKVEFLPNDPDELMTFGDPTAAFV